jgi:ABC-2 type transport system permease protein
MVAGAFLYLTVCSFRNRLRIRFRRLREPRYLVGLIAGSIYMWYFVFRNLFRRPIVSTGRGGFGPISGMVRAAGPFAAIGSLVLFAFTAISWLWPGTRPALAFTRAEVQFLFQAPLTRRQLVHYRLIRSQVGNIFGSVITTVFLRPGSLAMGWTTVAGMWLIFSIISVHSIGISLSHQSVRKAGWTGVARQWLPLTLILGSIAVLTATIALDWSHIRTLATARGVVDELEILTTTGIAGAILWPFRAMLRVPLAADATAFWLALPWGLLILVVNYLWVLQADAAFEEASAARSEQIAARLDAIRSGRRAAPVRRKSKVLNQPFALAPTGRPETAILWKNLIMVGRYLSLKTLLRLLPLLVVVLAFASRSHTAGVPSVLAILCLISLGFTIMLGPQIARNDLRQDLAQLGVLKAWPVSGPALLRGELMAPALVLTAIAWLLIGAGALLIGALDTSGSIRWMTSFNRLSFATAAMLIAPGVILAQLVVQNGIAVVFPAWVAVGTARARGIEATGQRLLMMAGNIVTLVLALLPGVLVGGAIAGGVYWKTGVLPIVIPALIVCAFLLVECWLAIEALGRVLERTDVSAVETSE